MRFALTGILFLTIQLFAQQTYLGWQAGLSFQFGTHMNRIGVTGKVNYSYDFISTNASAAILFNFQSFALKEKTPELQLGAGIQLGFARERTNQNYFIGLTEQHTDHSCSVGYAYLYYLDKQSTSQATGILSLNVFDFQIATENDLFGAGKGWRDRYRTGTLSLNYRYDSLKFGLSTVFWTGDYVGCTVVKDDPKYKTRWGYRLNDKATYGHTSVGAVYFQASALFPFQQTPEFRIGIDDERVRNFMQNKLIHNAPFAPDFAMKREVYHIPMFDENGNQYLYQNNQEIRPSKLYLQFGLNSFPFY